MARRPLIAGNWKMHLGPADADTFATELKRRFAGAEGVDLVVAPPAISIPAVASRLKHTGIDVAGQDLHPEPSGAYTGWVSGEMLKQAGAAYAIVGHSERRELAHEDDALIARKVKAAFRAGLIPIFCVGERLAERDAGRAEEVVLRQLGAGLQGLAPDLAVAVVIAYEPVWAIGTGRTATPEQAQAMHAVIRAFLAEAFPAWVAGQARILYGGSVKAGNARSLLDQPDIDGALVGGASLSADDFSAIVDAARGR